MRPTQQESFTLVELAAVMGIVVILAAVGLSIIGYSNAAALKARTRSQVETLGNALHEYRIEQGAYPDPGPPGVVDATTITNHLGNWLPSDFNPTDAWGRVCQYERMSPHACRVFSFGPSTDTAADDIESGR